AGRIPNGRPRGQRHAERRARRGNVVFAGDRGAVALHEMADDREAEPEAAMRPRGAANALTEASNTCGRNRKSTLIPLPLSRTISWTVSADRQATSIRPPASVNFTAFESRFHTTCCNPPASRERSNDRAQPYRAEETRDCAVHSSNAARHRSHISDPPRIDFSRRANGKKTKSADDQRMRRAPRLGDAS